MVGMKGRPAWWLFGREQPGLRVVPSGVTCIHAPKTLVASVALGPLGRLGSAELAKQCLPGSVPAVLVRMGGGGPRARALSERTVRTALGALSPSNRPGDRPPARLPARPAGDGPLPGDE